MRNVTGKWHRDVSFVSSITISNYSPSDFSSKLDV